MDKKTIAILLLTSLVLFLCWHKCEDKPHINANTDVLKKEIAKEVVRNDSIKKEAKKADSVRIITIIKYREAKTIKAPCDTILKYVIQACDTVIVKDSLAIEQYKQLVRSDSVIINKQAQVIRGDSAEIASLNKTLKKAKRRTKIAAVVAAILGGIAIVK